MATEHRGVPFYSESADKKQEPGQEGRESIVLSFLQGRCTEKKSGYIRQDPVE